MSRELKRSVDDASCPHCGSEEGCYVNERAVGWVLRHVNWNGEVEDTSYDKLRETIPRRATCFSCGKSVENPMWENR